MSEPATVDFQALPQIPDDQELRQSRQTKFLLRCSPAVFLGICLAAKTLLIVAVFVSGFRGFGGDDWGKMTIALQWAQQPSFAPTRTWAPMQFWTMGTAYHVTGDIYWAAVLVNSVWSFALPLLLYAWGRALLDEISARLAVILLILWPWNVWTAVSPQAEAMYQVLFLAIAYGLLRWQREGRTRWLVLAGALCLPLTAIRYQGWMLGLMLIGYLLGSRVLPSHPKYRWRLVLPIAALVLLFPLVWLGYNAYVHGSALHWFNSDYGDDPMRQPLSAWIAGGRFLAWVPVATPLLTPFLLFGAVRLRRLPLPEALTCGLFSYGYVFGMAAYGAVTGGQSPYVEQRYVVPAIIVALPLAACVINELRWRRSAKVALIVLICGWGVASSFRVTRQFANDEVAAGYLWDLWEQGVLSETSNVFVHKRIDADYPYHNDVRAIGVWSKRPSQVLGNSGSLTQAFEESLTESDESAREFLAAQRIHVVFTDSPKMVGRLSRLWQYGGSQLGYKVFFDPAHLQRPWIPPSEEKPSQLVSARWRNGVELVGVTPGGENAPEFPQYFIPVWRLPENEPVTSRARWEFDPLSPPQEAFDVVSKIGNRVTELATARRMHTISDRVVFVGESEAPERTGRYRLYLTIADETGRSIPLDGSERDDNRVSLGVVNVIDSKLFVIRRAVRGDVRDVGVTARVALSLVN